MGVYVRIEDFDPRLGVTEEDIAVAEAIIDRWTGDHFAPVQLTLRLVGNGTRLLYWHEGQGTHLGCVAVDSVSVDGVALEASAYHAGRDTLRRIDGDIWPADADIVVTGTFGWAEPPEPIRRVARMLVERERDPGRRKGAYVVESAEGYRYELQPSPRPGWGTGDPDIDNLLRAYLRRPIRPVMV